MPEIEIREFLEESGRSPFAHWFDNLNPAAAARVTIALTRLSLGNFSNVEGVGSGVFELKWISVPDIGFISAKSGAHIVILLGGSAKKRQAAAIAAAQSAWVGYKRRRTARS